MRFFKGQSPPFRGVAYRPDGRTLITATHGGVVTLWNPDTGSELARLKGRPGPPYRLPDVHGMALSPDGRLLATAGAELKVWNLDTGGLADGFDPGPIPAFRSVAFAMNGSRLVASIDSMFSRAYRQHGLAQWNTADGTTLPVLSVNDDVGSLVAGPVGESLFAWVNYRVVRWDLRTEQQYPTQYVQSSSLAASPVAKITAQGSYRTVCIFDANGERLLARWEAHKKGVFALAFSADGNLLATGSGDEIVKVWDVSGVRNVLADPNAPPLTAMPERGAYEWKLGPVRAIAFSPDGMTAAAVGDRVKFVVWDVE